MTKVIRSTTKGQITLPKSWRDKFGTDTFIMRTEMDMLIIKPLNLEEEEVIFDAERDNGGKGFSPEEMIQKLKKLRKHG